MKFFRVTYRLAAVIIWFILMTFYASYFHIVYKLLGKSKYELIRRLSYAERVWSGGLAYIVGLKVKVFGSIEGVDGMLVSNHTSYMDILTLGSVFPIRFTPKAEIAKWPLLGWFIRISAPIWVDRSSRQASKELVKEFGRTVKNSIRLVVFPEGTTSDGKGDLLPFKSAVFGVAVSENINLCPIIVRYRDNGEHEIAWYGDATLLGHIGKVLALKKIEAEVHVLDIMSPEGKNRKQISEELYQKMNHEYLNISKRSW